jgi:hypothetical protein
VGASNESDFGEYFNYPVINQKDWSGWRLPTKDEYEELLRDCSWSWTRVNDSMGYLVVGKNGNSIFIPAAGNNRIHANEKGWYWTSTPFNETQNKQSVLYISENEKKLAWSLCYAVNTSMLNGFNGVQSTLCQGFAGINDAITQSTIADM